MRAPLFVSYWVLTPPPPLLDSNVRSWWAWIWNQGGFHYSKGVFTWENLHQRKFHTGMTFLFRIAFTSLWVISYLGYLKVYFMLIKRAVENHKHYACVTRSKREFILHLHDTVAKFCTGVKFSLQYNNWGELMPGWLSPAWHLVVVSCKQM